LITTPWPIAMQITQITNNLKDALCEVYVSIRYFSDSEFTASQIHYLNKIHQIRALP